MKMTKICDTTFFSTILNKFDHGVIICEPYEKESPVLYVNESFLDMTGYRSDDVIGRNLDHIIINENEDLDNPFEIINKAIREKLEFNLKFKFIRMDRRNFWCDFKISPIYDEAGKLNLFICTFRDCTKEHIMEQAYLQENKELKRKLDAFRKSIKRCI